MTVTGTSSAAMWGTQLGPCNRAPNNPSAQQEEDTMRQRNDVEKIVVDDFFDCRILTACQHDGLRDQSWANFYTGSVPSWFIQTPRTITLLLGLLLCLPPLAC